MTKRLLPLLSLLSIAAILLGYTGPGNRTVTQTVETCKALVLECSWKAGKGWNWRQTGNDWACSNESKPWLAWPKLTGQSCAAGNEGEERWTQDVTSDTTTVTYAPVAISNAMTCGLPGSAGWCRGGLTQTFTASEPIPGYVVRYFEAASGTICDPADAAGVTCSRAIASQGSLSESAWAVSSFGDTSLMQSYSWKLDIGLPANTTSIPAPGGLNGWHKSVVSVSISGADSVSGIDPSGYRYRINSGAWQAGTSFSITSDGVYSIETEARDVAGNIRAQSVTVKKDATPPSVSLPYAPDGSNSWYRTLAVIAPAAADVTSGIDAVSPPVTLAEGTHVITATATDKAGNAASVSRTYRADITPPALTLDLPAPGGLNGWHKSVVSVSISGADSVSGIDPSGYRYRINSGAWQAGTSFTITSDGVYSIETEARDVAGNASNQAAAIRLDQTAPTISIPTSPDGSNGWYVTRPTITLAASDATSGIAWAVFDGYGADTVASLPDGVHPLTASAQDIAGNAWAISEMVRVDTQPPALAPMITAPAPSGWHTSSVTASANARDSISGLALVEYRVNTGAWQPGSSVTIADDGEYVIQFRAADNAGNQVTGAPMQFRLDQTKPTSAFSNPPEGSTTKISGAFTFSGASADALSGLDLAEISLDNGATWQPLTLASGNWSYAWDTRLVRDGTYTILARAVDRAGNRENTARVQVIAANAPPRIELQDSWWLWEAGRVRVRVGDIPVQAVTIQISCAPHHQDVTLRYTGDTLPSEIQWDRRCGEGAYAAESGDYPVTATVCDTWGRCHSASGFIRVPFFAPNIPTSTPAPAPEAVIQPPAIRPAAIPTALQAAAPVVIDELVPVAVVKSGLPGIVLRWWHLSAIAGLLLAFAVVSLSDPRPRALFRLAESVRKIGENR